MANTTNFGWETPDDTDLVKDGAAAIRTVAGAIDTSLVDLKGGTTNQVLAKNSDSDMDFKWVADASGIPATIFDAKGDLIVASAADTAARLAVGGTNGHVLTVNSGATNGIEWAAPSSGGMTVLASGSMPTGGTVLDLTSISGSYNNLQLVMRNLRFNGAYGMDIRVNNKTTGIYQRAMINGSAATFSTTSSNTDTGVLVNFDTMTNGAEPATIIVDLPDYTNTTAYKIINTTCYAESHDNSGTFQRTQNFSGVRTTEAIDRITTVNGSSQVTAGTYTLYGIK
jgi:hypothetical protein